MPMVMSKHMQFIALKIEYVLISSDIIVKQIFDSHCILAKFSIKCLMPARIYGKKSVCFKLPCFQRKKPTSFLYVVPFRATDLGKRYLRLAYCFASQGVSGADLLIFKIQ